MEGIVTGGERGEEEKNGSTVNKKFGGFIKHQQQESQGAVPLKKDGKLVNDPVGKAAVLNEQFQSVFSPRNPLPLKSLCDKALNFIKPSGKPDEPLSMPPIEITEEGVL